MPAELKGVPRDVTIRDSPNEFVVYANINGVTFTAEEVMMHFALRRQDDLSLADGVAKIFLSLSHAKRIAIVLAQLITEYEEIFGEIPADHSARLTEEGRSRLEKLSKEDVSKSE